MEPLEDSDPRQVGRYEIVARLGSGGMGRVYLARAASGEQFALKMIHQYVSEDAQFRRRFHREVVAARRVTGPNTAALVDADPDGRPPWMATEFVDGPTLSELIDRGGPLTPASCVRLAAGMAQALISIHGAGLVHRDLKPSNVLMGVEGARLIDFGIAQSSDASSVLTMTGLVTGSAGFMSPEQAQAEHVTEASDVFALGAVLYFAATGRRAFGEGSLISVTYRVVHADPDLAGIRDEGLRALIADCLQKDSVRRPTPDQIAARCPGILDGSWRLSRPETTVPALALAGPPDSTRTGALPLPMPPVAPWSDPRPMDTQSFVAQPQPLPGARPAGRDHEYGGGAGWFADLRARAPRAWLALPAGAVIVLAGAAAFAVAGSGGTSGSPSTTSTTGITRPAETTAPATSTDDPTDPADDPGATVPLVTHTYSYIEPTGRLTPTSTGKSTPSSSPTGKPTATPSASVTGKPKPPVTTTKPVTDPPETTTAAPTTTEPAGPTASDSPAPGVPNP